MATASIQIASQVALVASCSHGKNKPMVDIRFEQARAAHREASYYKAVHGLLIKWLADQYRVDSLHVANICDGSIDPSGRLLGEVRAAARRTPSLPSTERS